MTNADALSSMIRVDRPRPGIGRVTLARPDVRNAQSPAMLRELDAAFVELSTDEEVRVIILAADGPDFSSGHDLRAGFSLDSKRVASMAGSGQEAGIEGHHAFECEMYLGLSQRWRDIHKPTIAQAQGRTIAGGLMLLWPMDLIIASSDATFADPVTAFGVNGVEYFVHVWELGARKAKELLFTGEAITADEAYRLGMVNHVVPTESLEEFVLDLAVKIGDRPSFALKLAKASVNQSLDAQGQRQAVEAAFTWHTVGHAHNLAEHSQIVDPDGADIIRRAAVN